MSVNKEYTRKFFIPFNWISGDVSNEHIWAVGYFQLILFLSEFFCSFFVTKNISENVEKII